MALQTTTMALWNSATRANMRSIGGNGLSPEAHRGTATRSTSAPRCHGAETSFNARLLVFPLDPFALPDKPPSDTITQSTNGTVLEGHHHHLPVDPLLSIIMSIGTDYRNFWYRMLVGKLPTMMVLCERASASVGRPDAPSIASRSSLQAVTPTHPSA